MNHNTRSQLRFSTLLLLLALPACDTGGGSPYLAGPAATRGDGTGFAPDAGMSPRPDAGPEMTSGGGLYGNWYVKGAYCGLSLVFSSDGSFGMAKGCELDDGSIGLEIREGTYRIAGDALTQTFESSSCESRRRSVETVRFRLAGGRLTILLPDGDSVVFQRGKLPLDGSAPEVGCFDDGVFTPAS